MRMLPLLLALTLACTDKADDSAATADGADGNTDGADGTGDGDDGTGDGDDGSSDGDDGTGDGDDGSSDGDDGTGDGDDGSSDGDDGSSDGDDGTGDGDDGSSDGDDGTGDGDLSDYGAMSIWLDASALTGLSEGDAVTTWPDSSPAGNDVSQAEPSLQPAYRAAAVGGQPALEFDADGMQAAVNFSLTGDAAFTAITVANFPAVASGYPLAWVWGNCSVSAGCATLEGKGDTLVLATGWFKDAEPAAGSFDAHWGSPTIVTISKPAGPISDTRIFFNGVEQSVTGVGDSPAFTDGPFQVGSWNNSQPMRMDLAELIVYDGALSDADRSGAECLLGAKYGITATPTIGCE